MTEGEIAAALRKFGANIINGKGQYSEDDLRTMLGYASYLIGQQQAEIERLKKKAEKMEWTRQEIAQIAADVIATQLGSTTKLRDLFLEVGVKSAKPFDGIARILNALRTDKSDD